MDLLQDYFKLQDDIYEYFGYQEDWVVIPLEDCTGYYWMTSGETEDRFDEVLYSDYASFPDDKTYSADCYTQRFLPKWIYRGEDYTMLCCDTHVDGNKFLMIFSNDMKVDNPDEI